jgi:prefoldin subunit 5
MKGQIVQLEQHQAAAISKSDPTLRKQVNDLRQDIETLQAKIVNLAESASQLPQLVKDVKNCTTRW